MNEENRTRKVREQITRLALLRERHQELDNRVDELNSQRGLSQIELMNLKELKVRKLRLRDTITSLESEAHVNKSDV